MNLDTFVILDRHFSDTKGIFSHADEQKIHWSTLYVAETTILSNFLAVAQTILPTTVPGLKLNPPIYASMIRLVAFSKTKGKDAIINQILFEYVRSGNKVFLVNIFP